MKEQKLWFSARELAGLPGMPTTARRVREKAKREGWFRRKRQGRGGGSEYHRYDLPQETRAALAIGERPNNKAAPLPSCIGGGVVMGGEVSRGASVKFKLKFNARELAGRPGMPQTPHGVREKAKREGWERWKRAGRGGGWEYHYADLPGPTRVSLAQDGLAMPDLRRSTPQEVWQAERAAELARQADERSNSEESTSNLPASDE